MVAFARAEAGLFLSLSSLNPIKQDLAYNQIKPYHLIKSIWRKRLYQNCCCVREPLELILKWNPTLELGQI